MQGFKISAGLTASTQYNQKMARSLSTVIVCCVLFAYFVNTVESAGSSVKKNDDSEFQPHYGYAPPGKMESKLTEFPHGRKEDLLQTRQYSPHTKENLMKTSVKDQDEETMDTADTMVFRPLFRYKKQNVQKKKIYQNNPVHRENPPPVLVYDKTLGKYVPAPPNFHS